MDAKVRATSIAITLVLLLAAASAHARADFVVLSVSEAKESPTGKAKLSDVPFYMKGQSHKKVVTDLGTFTSNQRTNAFNKSDEEACKIAFLSAIIVFQKRAVKMGADAIVDIRSITKDQPYDDPAQFRCAAGNIIANVALSGRVVKFSE
jgi:uncharacterized protein YbjQ (UPF0145 family)